MIPPYCTRRLAGLLLDAEGTAEAYFDLYDGDNWHIYLGQSEPAKRIRATVYSIFQADSYLMLGRLPPPPPPEGEEAEPGATEGATEEGLLTGASIGYDAGFDFDVVAVTLKAFLSGEAGLSWTPQHNDRVAPPTATACSCPRWIPGTDVAPQRRRCPDGDPTREFRRPGVSSASATLNGLPAWASSDKRAARGIDDS